MMFLLEIAHRKIPYFLVEISIIDLYDFIMILIIRGVKFISVLGAGNSGTYIIKVFVLPHHKSVQYTHQED
jgi:hypothetical protein